MPEDIDDLEALEALAADARRWRTMRERYVGADFQWGDPKRCVMVFDLPNGVRVGADPDAIADALAVSAPPQEEPRQ